MGRYRRTRKGQIYIKEFIISPFIFPQLFEGNLAPWKTILLYGHVGTGKSLLVKAAATELQKLKGNFFSISFDDKLLPRNSKFFEDLIDFAIQKKPTVIFFDNITDLINSNGEYKSQFSYIFQEIEKNSRDNSNRYY